MMRYGIWCVFMRDVVSRMRYDGCVGMIVLLYPCDVYDVYDMCDMVLCVNVLMLYIGLHPAASCGTGGQSGVCECSSGC